MPNEAPPILCVNFKNFKMQNQIKIKVLAYYLPQFHECEFNNKWWGKGFTEWNNVRMSFPQFIGHNQPRSPLSGEYNLLNDGVIGEQFSKAMDAGIDGFAIYHYWYKGKRPLGKVLDKILEDKTININFSLCWANHSWTRSWQNNLGALDVLIDQEYESYVDEMMLHIDFLIGVFSDPRYIRVNGMPLFQIYIPEDVFELSLFLKKLRSECRLRLGVDMYVGYVLRSMTFKDETIKLFDFASLAQPTLAFNEVSDLTTQKLANENFVLMIRRKILGGNKILRIIGYALKDLLPKKCKYFDYEFICDKLYCQSMSCIGRTAIPVNFTAFIDFDNTPRYKKRARIIRGFSIDLFRMNIGRLMDLSFKNESEILFINAWNEWGEGMYLEGDSLYGEQRLKALKEVLSKYK